MHSCSRSPFAISFLSFLVPSPHPADHHQLQLPFTWGPHTNLYFCIFSDSPPAFLLQQSCQGSPFILTINIVFWLLIIPHWFIAVKQQVGHPLFIISIIINPRIRRHQWCSGVWSTWHWLICLRSQLWLVLETRNVTSGFLFGGIVDMWVFQVKARGCWD